MAAQQFILCVLFSYTSLTTIQKHRVFHNNAFMANLAVRAMNDIKDMKLITLGTAMQLFRLKVVPMVWNRSGNASRASNY